jgi:hypothetical protein
MALLRTIRNVIGNLAAGQDAASVHRQQNQVASKAFMQRLRALEATERFLAEAIKPGIPRSLHGTLDRVVAHVEQPIASLDQLAARVREASMGQSMAVGRADWPATHAESAHARDLVALGDALVRLAGTAAKHVSRDPPPSPPGGAA